MATAGFCYVADCDAYVDEAMRSIGSLRKHMPDAQVALVTHPKLFRHESKITDWVELRQSRYGPIVKTDAWFAPYDRVVFLDTDTLILNDLAGVFPLLDEFDFVSVAEPNPRPDYGIYKEVPVAFPEPNSGVFAFRKTAEVRGFFELWVEEYDALRDLAGVTADQPSLRIALWQSKLRPLTLGSEFNLILHANCSVSQPVRIIHDRSPEREWVSSVVNRHLSPRAVVAGFGPIFGFFTRRGWIRQYLRLTWRFLHVLLQPNSVKQQGHPVIWWRDGID